MKKEKKKKSILSWEEVQALKREIGLLMKNGIIPGDSRSFGKKFVSMEFLLSYKKQKEMWIKIIDFLKRYAKMPKKQPITKQKIINQIKKKIRKRLKELAFEDGNVDENWQVLYKKLVEDIDSGL